MSKLRQAGLLCAGLLGGILISLQYSALADKDPRNGLPVEDLRTFAEVFSAVKQGYVEPVDDKKLIANAISGMLSNLDPHSTYLDADAYKDLQVSTQGEFGGRDYFSAVGRSGQGAGNWAEADGADGAVFLFSG